MKFKVTIDRILKGCNNILFLTLKCNISGRWQKTYYYPRFSALYIKLPWHDIEYIKTPFVLSPEARFRQHAVFINDIHLLSGKMKYDPAEFNWVMIMKHLGKMLTLLRRVININLLSEIRDTLWKSKTTKLKVYLFYF